MEVGDDRQILVEFVEVSLTPGPDDVLYLSSGDQVLIIDGGEEYVPDFVATDSSVVIAFQSDNVNVERGFWLRVSDFSPGEILNTIPGFRN